MALEQKIEIAGVYRYTAPVLQRTIAYYRTQVAQANAELSYLNIVYGSSSEQTQDGSSEEPVEQRKLPVDQRDFMYQQRREVVLAKRHQAEGELRSARRELRGRQRFYS